MFQQTLSNSRSADLSERKPWKTMQSEIRRAAFDCFGRFEPADERENQREILAVETWKGDMLETLSPL